MIHDSVRCMHHIKSFETSKWQTRVITNEKLSLGLISLCSLSGKLWNVTHSWYFILSTWNIFTETLIGEIILGVNVKRHVILTPSTVRTSVRQGEKSDRDREKYWIAFMSHIWRSEGQLRNLYFPSPLFSIMRKM